MPAADFLGMQTPIQLTVFRAPAITYFTDASTKGRVYFAQLPWVIGVIEALDNRLVTNWRGPSWLESSRGLRYQDRLLDAASFPDRERHGERSRPPLQRENAANE